MFLIPCRCFALMPKQIVVVLKSKKTLRQRVEGRRGKNGMPKMAFYFVAASKTLMRIWVKAPPGADPGCSSGYSNSEQIVGAIVQCFCVCAQYMLLLCCFAVLCCCGVPRQDIHTYVHRREMRIYAKNSLFACVVCRVVSCRVRIHAYTRRW